MLRKPLNKIRSFFLESAFPENPLPFKKLNRRAFKALKDSNKRGFTNRIKRVENRIVKRENVSNSLKENFAHGRDQSVTTDNATVSLLLTRGKSQQEITRQGYRRGLGLAKKGLIRKRKPGLMRSKYIFSLEQLFASFYNKQSSYKKSSVFKNLLKERKRLSLIYGGLGEKQIQRVALEAKGFDGKFDENFVKIVERRLDVALFRICFFPTVFSAKQWINHKHILVNNSVVTLPGFQLSSGDVITIAPEKKSVLKKKISFFVAEKIKCRSRHYCLRLNTFYTLVKNLFFTNKNLSKKIKYKIVQSSGLSKNNTQLRSLLGVTKHFRNQSPKTFLRVRNLFTTARSLTQRVKSLRISGMKPLNLEVCYKNMVAVFLYSPQKVAVPTSLNLQAIQP